MNEELIVNCMFCLMISDGSEAAVAALVPFFGVNVILLAIDRINPFSKPVRAFNSFIQQNKASPEKTGL